MVNEKKPEGWFSRRHQTNEEHRRAGMHHTQKGERKVNAEIRQNYRDTLTDEEQLARLEKRGHGQCKEAKRLIVKLKLSGKLPA